MPSTQEFETIQPYESAIRFYKQIIPRPVQNLSDSQTHKIRVWLKDEVARVVEDFAKRQTFREFASRSLRTLADGARTPERLCITAVDAAFVACAKNLSELCADSSIHRKLVEQNPPRSMVSSEDVTINADGATRTGVRQELVDVLAVEIAQVEAIAKGPWDDLVSVNDYFEPRQEWNDNRGGKPTQRGELIVSLNPELHALGDFVVRGLRQRVDGLYETLAAVRRKYLAAIAGNKDSLQPAALREQWEQLEAQKAKLDELCFTGPENSMRDSCVILTQAYAAFHVKPDLEWLGLPRAVVQEGIGAIRSRLRQFQNAEMIERIAAALGDLRKLYEGGAPDLSARDEAIASGSLVIDVHRAEVYWEGQPLAGPWKGRSWDFLVAMAKKALRGSYVTEGDIFDDAQSDSTMATTCGRLKEKLPFTLAKLISPGHLARTYRLDLEPDRIYIANTR